MATPETVAAYLSRTYVVDEEAALNLVSRAPGREAVLEGVRMSAFDYWVGDKIAGMSELEPRPERDDDGSDDDEVEDEQ